MTNWLRTRPVNEPDARLTIVLRASCIFMISTLPLFLLGFVVVWIMNDPSKENASVIGFGFIYWLMGLFFMVPALLVAAPFANVALRRGFAGWGVSIFACSVMMTLACLLMALPDPDITVLYVGVAAGCVCGLLFWVGAFYAKPSTFRSTLPESD